MHSRASLCLFSTIVVTFNEDNEEFKIIIKKYIPLSYRGNKLELFNTATYSICFFLLNDKTASSHTSIAWRTGGSHVKENRNFS